MPIDSKARERLLNQQRDDQLIAQANLQTQIEAQKTQGFLNFFTAIYQKLSELTDNLKNFTLPQTYPVKGSVSVDKLPDVKIANFPETQQIAGQIEITNLKLPEEISIKNFPLQDDSKLTQIMTFLKSWKLVLPSIYPVKGSVDINNLPPVEVSNIPDLAPNLNQLAQSINQMQQQIVSAIIAQKITLPKSFDINSPVQMQGMQDLLDDMEELKKGFNLLIKATQASKGTDSKTPMMVEIISDRVPRPVTNPVTNISINALGGIHKATAVTVSNTATPLPASPLANRRGIIIYNNGSVTVFVGGATVTAAQGLPVAAGSYGPALEAGSTMLYYGITSTGSSDIRVLEYSDIMTGRALTLPS